MPAEVILNGFRHPSFRSHRQSTSNSNSGLHITRLLGPKKWSYYYLYVIMDIYSRYVVGWMVADRENSALAGRLIQQSCLKHGVQPRVLTLHSDRGAPMTSQCTAQLLADLGVTRSLSRPQVSDDNPFSEAQFKTLKYHPSFPGRFGDQGQAKTFCRSFFRWYMLHFLAPSFERYGRGPRGRFRVQDSANRASIQDKETGALVRVLGSDPRRLHGAAPRILLLDELAQWPPGQVAPMLAALVTSRGKIPGSKALWIGTRPSTSDHPFQRGARQPRRRLLSLLRGPAIRPAIPAADVAQGKPRPRSFSRPGGGDPPRGEGREAR